MSLSGLSTSMRNKIVLITGANTGIGLATAQGLLERGSVRRAQGGGGSNDVDGSGDGNEETKRYTVLIASRSLQRAQRAVDALRADAAFEPAWSRGCEAHAMRLDVDDDASVQEAAEEVKGRYGRLDVLVHNAGISLDPEITSGRMSFREASHKSYSTNAISPHVLSYALMPLLFASSGPLGRRIIFISSGLSSVSGVSEDTSPPEGWPKDPHFNLTTYRASKAAVNMVAAELRRELRHDGFVVHTLCPGFWATGLVGDKENMAAMGAGDPREGGRFVVKVLEGERDADEGGLVNAEGIRAL